MSLSLILAIALTTYLSRAAALLLLPNPSSRTQAFLNRIPAPLFAGLAALSVLGGDGQLASAPVLAAIAGATALAPTRSLPKVLAGGLVGWASGTFLLS